MNDNNVCPICEQKIDIFTKSGIKYNGTNICMNCSKKLAKCGINIFNIKNYDEEYLKNIEKNTIIEKPIKKMKSSKNFICCPNCQSTNVDLISNDKNMKVRHETSVNLNPLKPFTLYNTKEIKKEKKSLGKLALGVFTGGSSILITGTKNKKHNEYFCRNCGRKWVSKY